ncbi:MAG: trypsin-like peptidase domain-containing protein [Eubacterium sp.]|nr:trypsin-like peptidase domain-containing protein [Eubacterium sp.]
MDDLFNNNSFGTPNGDDAKPESTPTQEAYTAPISEPETAPTQEEAKPEPPKADFTPFGQPIQPTQPEPQKAQTEYTQVIPPTSGTSYIPPVQQQSYNQNSYSAPYYQPSVAFEQNANTPQAKKAKKKNKTLVIIVIIFIICAFVAGYGVWSSSNGGKDSDKATTSQSDSSSDESESKSNNSSSAEAQVEGSEANPETDEEGNLTAVGVSKNNRDSCVGITVYTVQSDYYYFYSYGEQQNNDGEKVASGEGSGVIMAEADGKTYIMTCAHVIADGSSFKVTLENDKEYDAEMVGYDSQTDIGVLAINATGLKVAKFGDSKDIEVGERCVAIGCPGGLTFKNSVTEGIVSALDVPVSSQIGYKNECIQVDAAINPGNSGGALFNMQGQVIGINSSKIASTEYEGMGFAVPSNTAVETANSLIKNGYVSGRAKIGIEYNSLSVYTSATNILAALAEKGYKDAEGTMVIQTISDESDLKNKGIKQYDMIVAVDGETLTSTDVMTSKLSKSKPGDTVTLTIARIENNSIKIQEVKCKLIESKG